MLKRKKRLNRSAVPQATLRIPGIWGDLHHVGSCLPQGFRIEKERLIAPAGPEFYLGTMAADAEFPSIFRMSCRRRDVKEHELTAIDHYSLNAMIVGSAGTITAAQQLLEVGAALIDAGGLGVFIDNSVLSHTASDWLDLAQHRTDLDAVFYAFVNMVRLPDKMISHGMHVLGKRDATFDKNGDPDALHDFLRMASKMPGSLQDGEIYADELGRCYRLRGEQDRSPFPNHPINNPYGRWRLLPV